MIARSFYNKPLRRYAHLVVCGETGAAAIIDPVAEDLALYAIAAEAAGARIVCGLQTAARPVDPRALAEFRARFDAGSKTPVGSFDEGDANERVEVGHSFKLGALEIEIVANTPPAGPDVAYRVGDTLFTGWAMVRGGAVGEEGPIDSDDLVDRARRDLDAMRTARKLTPREAELADVYVALLDRLGRPPSAQEIASEHSGADRGAVHVLIHGVRRKQIALGQVPMLLSGQMHKWLKGLRGEPDYTPNERLFLETYLAFVDANGRPPTGPEIQALLPERPTIQWVRKRVHTIRRKQAAFGQTPLQMGREARRTR